MNRLLQVQPVTYVKENKVVRRSFAAGVSKPNSLGKLRVPEPFIEEFGENIPRDINIICNGGMMWKAIFDREKGKIVGLEGFMKIHMVKQMYTLLLEYLGDDDFNIKIYNFYGVEVYQYKCMWLSDNENAQINLGEYVLGVDALEDEKARSLFFSSAYRRKLRFYELSIDENDSYDWMQRMLLPKNMSDLYSKWNNGAIIKLYFVEKDWEVKIEIYGDDIYLANGWTEFVKDCGIGLKDIVIFNAVIEPLFEMVQVCLFKSGEIYKHELRSAIGSRNASFFHVINLHTLIHKEIVPPILVRKFYDDHLSMVSKLRFGGNTFSVSYNKNSQALENIRMILEMYDLQMNDTFFITTTDNGEANMRIFRRDGLEIEYKCQYATHIISLGHWFMKGKWNKSYSVKKEIDAESQIFINTLEETNDDAIDSREVINEIFPNVEGSDGDDDVIEDADHIILGEFVSTLTKSNVDTKCHGVYISKELDAFIGDWNSGQIIFLVRNGRQWNVGINVTNGRKRFSAKWGLFVRDNELKENDMVRFSLREDGETFDVEVVVD